MLYTHCAPSQAASFAPDFVLLHRNKSSCLQQNRANMLTRTHAAAPIGTAISLLAPGACSGAAVRARRCAGAATPLVLLPAHRCIASAAAVGSSSSSSRKHRRPLRLWAVSQAAAGSTPPQPLTIAITGATGLIGSRLTAKLASQGNRVRVLTRDVNAARSKLPYGNLLFFGPNQFEQAVVGADAVVNLAGTPIGTRCAVCVCWCGGRWVEWVSGVGGVGLEWAWSGCGVGVEWVWSGLSELAPSLNQT